MKRFHLHLAVQDINKNVDFYSQLFGQAPNILETDYAKWMLDEPRINFAISNRKETTGLDHLGFQVDSIDELNALQIKVNTAGIETLAQPQATCCYASSEKYWTLDPQGVAWETFYTHGQQKTFGQDDLNAPGTTSSSACCIPLNHATSQAISLATSQSINQPKTPEKSTSCCIPNKNTAASGCCPQ